MSIKDIINKLDPLGIKNITPDDEYSHEIKAIESGLKLGMTYDNVYDLVLSVFKENFPLEFIETIKDEDWYKAIEDIFKELNK